MAVGQIAIAAVSVAGAAVALWLLIRSAHGRPRLLGIVGTALILLGALSRVAFHWMVERFLGSVGDSTIISALAATNVVGGVLTGAGLLLATRAIVVAGWPAALQPNRHRASAKK
jgi:hypothetical protein